MAARFFRTGMVSAGSDPDLGLSALGTRKRPSDVSPVRRPGARGGLRRGFWSGIGPRSGGARCAALLILAVCAWGTHERNRVWRDEESLWHDVTIKSPRNGRGLMNYGLTLMAKAQNAEALELFSRALEFTPNYFILEINLAIVYGELASGRRSRTRISVAPCNSRPTMSSRPFYYGRWLMTRGRVAEAIPQFQTSIIHNRDYLDPRYALMQAYMDIGMQPLAKSLAADTLQMAPGDAAGHALLPRTGRRRSFARSR